MIITKPIGGLECLAFDGLLVFRCIFVSVCVSPLVMRVREVRGLYRLGKKNEDKPLGLSSYLVRVTGLEPVRRGHTPLKRACLPIPAHSHI